MDLEGEPPQKKTKVLNGSRNDDEEKVPTREELTQLKENETLFNSSLFRLQIEELLSEVKVPSKFKSKFVKWFEEFRNFLFQVPKDTNIKYIIDETTKLLPPLQKSKNAIKTEKFGFYPPEEVKVIGGYGLDVALYSGLSIDVLVRIPKKCFQNDDNLNLRYHYKRARYLTHLANILLKSDLVDSVQYEYHNGDQLKPALVIVPKGKHVNKCSLKLLLCSSSKVFKITKLAPQKNNVRTSWFYNDTGIDHPTPHYNSSVLSDVLMESMFDYLNGIITQPQSQGIRDGILLLKVWSRQRELSLGYGAVNNFILTMYVAHLLQTKVLHHAMSSYQVARKTLISLNNCDWSGVLNKNSNYEDFLLHFPVVFLDASGCLNLCANIQKTTFFRLKHEVELSVLLLDAADNFDALFMTPINFIRKFDHIIHIKDIPDCHTLVKKFDVKEKCLDYFDNYKLLLLPKILDIMSKGFGKRVDLMDVKLQATPQWPITEVQPTSSAVISIGLLLNFEHASSIVDKGPSAETPEARDFISFWGSKSETRRFQDTSICEAVVWPCKTISDRRVICSQVTTYLLEKYFNIPATDIYYTGGKLNPLLLLNIKEWPNDWPPFGTGEELLAKTVQVLDTLRKELMKLDKLPLAITSVHGISPTFRYSEVFPPFPDYFEKNYLTTMKRDNFMIPMGNIDVAPKYVHRLDVVIELEGSNKWPNDADAVKRIKAAFYLKISTLLTEQLGLLCMATENHVAILKEGYVFCLQIAYKRESTLLKAERSSDGILRRVENERSLKLEREIIHLPKLTSSIHGLQLQQGTFSCACRLAKRWVSSQLLAEQVSDIAIELTMAHVYIHSGPFTAPMSPEVAFQRWLYLIGNHNWKSVPLIVNLNSELTQDDITDINSKFMSNREALPPLFIATPDDKYFSLWSRDAPVMPVFLRLISLAKSALQTLQSTFEDMSSDFKPIFRPSLAPYDVIIHLRRFQIPLRHCSVDNDAKEKTIRCVNFKDNKFGHIPIFGFDPVACYVEELKATFDEFAAFFYDKYGGDVICVLWKPKAFTPVEFKVSNINSRKPKTLGNEEETMIIANVEYMIEEFSILGTDLVKSIEARSEKWNI